VFANKNIFLVQKPVGLCATFAFWLIYAKACCASVLFSDGILVSSHPVRWL